MLMCTVKCMTAEGSATSLQRAQGMIDELQNSHCSYNRMPVHLLQLEVALAGDQVSEEELTNIMALVVRCAPLSEHIFKM